MKNVNIDKSRFKGSDFRGVIGLNSRQMKIIKASGGILNDKDNVLLKDQQKNLSILAGKYHKYKDKCEAIKKEMYKIAESNPVHGDSTDVTNKYKIF